MSSNLETVAFDVLRSVAMRSWRSVTRLSRRSVHDSQLLESLRIEEPPAVLQVPDKKLS
jgi:hypothetical protein